jgi:hypothetical protein
VTITASKDDPPKGWLEVTVQERASEADVERVIQALSVISSFFGASLEREGSGGGGLSMAVRTGGDLGSGDQPDSKPESLT